MGLLLLTILYVFLTNSRGSGGEGLEGPSGLIGSKGLQGQEFLNYGVTGPSGPQGPKGPAGPQGPIGIIGPPAIWRDVTVNEYSTQASPQVILEEASSSTENQRVYDLMFNVQGPRSLPNFIATCTSSRQPQNSVTVSASGPIGSETLKFAFDIVACPQGNQGESGAKGPQGPPISGPQGVTGPTGPAGTTTGPSGTGLETYVEVNPYNVPLYISDLATGANYRIQRGTLGYTIADGFTVYSGAVQGNVISSGINMAQTSLPEGKYNIYMPSSITGTIKLTAVGTQDIIIYTFQKYSTCSFTISLHDDTYGFFNMYSGMIIRSGITSQQFVPLNYLQNEPFLVINDSQDNSSGTGYQLKFDHASNVDSRWNNSTLRYEIMMSTSLPFS